MTDAERVAEAFANAIKDVMAEEEKQFDNRPYEPAARLGAYVRFNVVKGVLERVAAKSLENITGGK